ncbi:hypothetical protein I33_0299 [Bacillus subtilis subsp. subtilis str. RO-NN-1]|nr:hypothetical protein [Bacillus subtilis]AEP89319.1 hypothetical protein I33_0299 [Bacillus subtilis subsp. subtilis str. RO-NN-1]UVZ58272.1 hypothetical protein NYR91_01465 [Bacillus subtilis]
MNSGIEAAALRQRKREACIAPDAALTPNSPLCLLFLDELI